MKYVHGVVLFWLYLQYLVDSWELFIYILQGCFTGNHIAGEATLKNIGEINNNKLQQSENLKE